MNPLEIVKKNLKEYGYENDRFVRSMAMSIVRDVIKAIEGTSTKERRSQTRTNQAARAGFSAAEGLNPRGPEWF